MVSPRLLTLWLAVATAGPAPAAPPRDPLVDADLPAAWKQRFWESPEAQALLALEPAALAQLVPAQAGFHFCGCPACGASETEDPLTWSPQKPEVVTCRRCAASFPNEKFPAKIEIAPGKPPAIPEEAVEVRPGRVHHYPYHLAEPTRQSYPDERFYLSAKRDDEARRFLARAALYLAVRAREQRDPSVALRAAALIVRFAQVYPVYAAHYDVPGRAKALHPADLRPPYRASYGTAKWDHSGALEVPLNLVLAYSILRNSPALREAGMLLGDESPGRTIERDFLRAAARFSRDQPEEPGEASLYVIRGLLAVGRLLGDNELTAAGCRRLRTLTRQSFSHDGLWADPRGSSQRRVVWMLDAWIEPWVPEAQAREMRGLLTLARAVPDLPETSKPTDDVMLAAWPAPRSVAPGRGPILLGGAGIVRLAVGEGPTALDLELSGAGGDGTRPATRLALRVAVGGQPALGDLDELPGRPDGLDRATASHNALLIDGLNQRESLALANQPDAGADILFYATDPDFQVAMLDDPRAYPRSADRYRHLVLTSTGPVGTYAVSLADVRGGLQHDQILAAAPGHEGRWQLTGQARPGPRSLLAPTLLYLPDARAENGRWFVQALGSFTELAQSPVTAPIRATLTGGPSALRAHVLGDLPATAYTATEPAAGTARRAALVLRRRSDGGETLASRFLTVLEPRGGPALRIGRVESPPESLVVVVMGERGTEHLVINARPGTEQTIPLTDGRSLVTDGLAVRVRGQEIVLAGGTVARIDSTRVEHAALEGTLRIVESDEQGRGLFATDARFPPGDSLVGRALLIRHGDGITRGWTIRQVDTLTDGTRIQVREAAGFHIDRRTGEARYDSFPGTSHPGPHRFQIARLSR